MTSALGLSWLFLVANCTSSNSNGAPSATAQCPSSCRSWRPMGRPACAPLGCCPTVSPSTVNTTSSPREANDLGERASLPGRPFVPPFALDVFNADRELPSGRGQPRSPFTTVTASGLRVSANVGAQVGPWVPRRRERKSLGAVCADHQAVLVAIGVQGESHVDGCRPSSCGVALGAPHVKATPARSSVAGEVERLAVWVEKWGFVLRVRIQR